MQLSNPLSSASDQFYEFFDECTDVQAVAEGRLGLLFGRNILIDHSMVPNGVALFCRVSWIIWLRGCALMGPGKATKAVPGMCPRCGKPGPFINLQMVCPEHGPYQ